MRAVAFAIVLASYVISIPHVKELPEAAKSAHAAIILIVSVGFLFCAAMGV